MFPDVLNWPLERWVNEASDWIVVSFGPEFKACSHIVLVALLAVESIFRALPWWLVISIIAAIAYHATRTWKLPLLTTLCMVFVGSLGLWDLAMQTMALVMLSVALAIIIGVPFGILLAYKEHIRPWTVPLLDAMQTMPPFVYLIPALMLFGVGKVPAVIATVIYAIPPVVRLTDLGIRLVDQEVVEAARAFGTGPYKRLFSVDLPLALPNIMAGINQCTMLALGMVVLASMIGARGLGEEILYGIQRLDVGKGFAGGLAIVAIAIVLDRITQAYGRGKSALRENRQ